MPLPDITITTRDLVRLTSLLEADSASAQGIPGLLDEELARAHVVPSRAISASVVTMNSRFRFEEAGLVREVTLVYPHEADAELGRISVLSPQGCALLGLRVGQSVDWSLPNGECRRVRVLSISYQPEAAGHFHL